MFQFIAQFWSLILIGLVVFLVRWQAKKHTDAKPDVEEINKIVKPIEDSLEIAKKANQYVSIIIKTKYIEESKDYFFFVRFTRRKSSVEIGKTDVSSELLCEIRVNLRKNPPITLTFTGESKEEPFQKTSEDVQRICDLLKSRVGHFSPIGEMA